MHEMWLHMVSQIQKAAQVSPLQDHTLGQGSGEGRLQTLRCRMGPEGRRDAEVLPRVPFVDVEQREEDIHLSQVRQDPQPPFQPQFSQQQQQHQNPPKPKKTLLEQMQWANEHPGEKVNFDE